MMSNEKQKLDRIRKWKVDQYVAVAVVTLFVKVHLVQLAGLHLSWMAPMRNPPQALED